MNVDAEHQFGAPRQRRTRCDKMAEQWNSTTAMSLDWGKSHVLLNKKGENWRSLLG